MRHDPELDRIMGRGRLAEVIAHLADADEPFNQTAQLTDHERAALVRAISTTTHPLRGVALGMLEEWDSLAAPDQGAGLLLFATIARNPGNRLTRSRPPVRRHPRLEL